MSEKYSVSSSGESLLDKESGRRTFLAGVIAGALGAGGIYEAVTNFTRYVKDTNDSKREAYLQATVTETVDQHQLINETELRPFSSEQITHIRNCVYRIQAVFQKENNPAEPVNFTAWAIEPPDKTKYRDSYLVTAGHGLTDGGQHNPQDIISISIGRPHIDKTMYTYNKGSFQAVIPQTYKSNTDGDHDIGLIGLIHNDGPQFARNTLSFSTDTSYVTPQNPLLIMVYPYESAPSNNKLSDTLPYDALFTPNTQQMPRWPSAEGKLEVWEGTALVDSGNSGSPAIARTTKEGDCRVVGIITQKAYSSPDDAVLTSLGDLPPLFDAIENSSDGQPPNTMHRSEP